MFKRIRIDIWCSGVFALGILIFSAVAWAQPLHSAMLTVPDRSEEALNWCGPATGQMIMEGYPSGSCPKLQEDIWMAIQNYRAETMWDTDPAGLKEAMKRLCPPSGTWVIDAAINPQELMYAVAYWMTKNHYPAAALMNTLSHNSYAPHGEHWVAIRGIVTDKDPTLPGNTSVNLEFVWFNDPVAVPFGSQAIVRYVSGSTWYSELKPVAKSGSGYQGKYVAVIEPPAITGKAVAPVEVLTGRIISREDALKYAAKWIAEYKLYEMEPYRLLKEAKPGAPLLVNKQRGGYYIIPYTPAGSKFASSAVLINAYTGNFQEAGAFRPASYISREDAINLSLRHLKTKRPRQVDAELVYPMDGKTTSRYFPEWKIAIDRKILGVDHQGKIIALPAGK